MKEPRIPTSPKEAKEFEWTTVKQAKGRIPLLESPRVIIRGHEYYPNNGLARGMTAENWLKNWYMPQLGEAPIFKDCYSAYQVERVRSRFDWEVWQRRKIKAGETPAALIRWYQHGGAGWLETEVFRYDQTESK